MTGFDNAILTDLSVISVGVARSHEKTDTAKNHRRLVRTEETAGGRTTKDRGGQETIRRAQEERGEQTTTSGRKGATISRIREATAKTKATNGPITSLPTKGKMIF